MAESVFWNRIGNFKDCIIDFNIPLTISSKCKVLVKCKCGSQKWISTTAIVEKWIKKHKYTYKCIRCRANRQLLSSKSKTAWAQYRDRIISGMNQSWTQDRRQAHSELMKRKWNDDLYRNTIMESKTGLNLHIKIQQKWHDQGYRDKISKSIKKKWGNGDYKIDAWNSLEFKEKCSKTSKKWWGDPDNRARRARQSRARWENPEYRKKMAVIHANQPRISSLQNILYSILDGLNIVYYREYPDKPADSQCLVGPYTFDCVVPRRNGRSLLIECQGDYWHSMRSSVARDESKATYINRYHSNHYELKYIWEHEFLNHNKVVELIKQWMGMLETRPIDYNMRDIVIRRSKASEYRLLLSKYHYLHSAGRNGVIYGAYLGDELIAICMFAELSDGARELQGFCINPKYHKEGFARWFVPRCIDKLPSRYATIVLYCDILNCSIYEAIGFVYDEILLPDYWYECNDGWVMHKRTLYRQANKMNMDEDDFAKLYGYKKMCGGARFRLLYRRLHVTN